MKLEEILNHNKAIDATIKELEESKIYVCSQCHYLFISNTKEICNWRPDCNAGNNWTKFKEKGKEW